MYCVTALSAAALLIVSTGTLGGLKYASRRKNG